MKILIVGKCESRRSQLMLSLLREKYPDAEFEHAENVDLGKATSETLYWLDEVSTFVEPKVFKTGFIEDASLPIREKIVHPWTRRKKK